MAFKEKKISMSQMFKDWINNTFADKTQNAKEHQELQDKITEYGTVQYSAMPDFKNIILLERADEDQKMLNSQIYKINVPGYFVTMDRWSDNTAEIDFSIWISNKPEYLYRQNYGNHGAFARPGYPNMRFKYSVKTSQTTFAISTFDPIYPGTSTYVTFKGDNVNTTYAYVYFVPCLGITEICPKDKFVERVGKSHHAWIKSPERTGNPTDQNIIEAFSGDWRDNLTDTKDNKLSDSMVACSKWYTHTCVYVNDPAKRYQDTTYFFDATGGLCIVYVTSEMVDEFIEKYKQYRPNWEAEMYNVRHTSNYGADDFYRNYAHRGPLRTDVAAYLEYQENKDNPEYTKLYGPTSIDNIEYVKNANGDITNIIVTKTIASIFESMRDKWCIVHRDWGLWNKDSTNIYNYVDLVWNVSRKKNQPRPPQIQDIVNGDWWFEGDDIDHRDERVCLVPRRAKPTHSLYNFEIEARGYLSGLFDFDYNKEDGTFVLTGFGLPRGDTYTLYFDRLFKYWNTDWKFQTADDYEVEIEDVTPFVDSYNNHKVSTDTRDYDLLTITKNVNYITIGPNQDYRILKFKITGKIICTL